MVLPPEVGSHGIYHHVIIFLNCPGRCPSSHSCSQDKLDWWTKPKDYLVLSLLFIYSSVSNPQAGREPAVPSQRELGRLGEKSEEQGGAIDFISSAITPGCVFEGRFLKRTVIRQNPGFNIGSWVWKDLVGSRPSRGSLVQRLAGVPQKGVGTTSGWGGRKVLPASARVRLGPQHGQTHFVLSKACYNVQNG